MSDSHDNKMTVVTLPPARGMSPVVSTGLEILRNNPNPETLRELLSMQRDWEAGEARKAYSAALVALKRDLPSVINRDKTVDFTGRSGVRTYYTHASLAGAMEAVTAPLTQHGFSLTWHPTTNNGQVGVTCRLTHSGGHFEEVSISAPIDNSGNKSPAQGVASTITLLSRYTALALLGIATDDMEGPNGERAPEGADDGKVDSSVNLSVAGALKKYGKTVGEAQELVGRDVPDWTASDVRKIKAWAKAGRGETSNEG